MNEPARRTFLRMLGAGAGLIGLGMAGCATPEILPKSGRRVVVVGGGFGGAIAAKYLRLFDPALEVVLVERNRKYVASPFSNQVITGLRDLEGLTLGYEALAERYGVRLVFDEITTIDPGAATVVTRSGRIRYDRLILAPGIDFRSESISGYDPQSTPELMPHAWQAGPQTLLLKRQLQAMPDGGRVLIAIPAAPFRCPPGPYERASLIAAWLKRNKPRAKVIMLDANADIVAMGGLFREAWKARYAGMIEYLPATRVSGVDATAHAFIVEGIEKLRGDVLNLIPPQRAGAIAARADLLEEGGHWCPVDPRSFESTRHPGIHVIGDAAIAGAMPKSGYAANSQAKICALNVVALMNGKPPHELDGINVCYAAVGEQEDISIAQVFRVIDGRIVATTVPGGASPPDLSRSRLEHRYAESWLRNILAEMSS